MGSKTIKLFVNIIIFLLGVVGCYIIFNNLVLLYNASSDLLNSKYIKNIILGVLLPFIGFIALYPLYALSRLDENTTSINNKLDEILKKIDKK